MGQTDPFAQYAVPAQQADPFAAYAVKPAPAKPAPTAPKPSPGDAAIQDLKTRTDNAHKLFESWVKEGPHRVVEGIRELMGGDYAKGMHNVLAGGGMTALPMVAPKIGPAIMAAPGAAALTASAGIAAQQAAPPVARALGASPDQADVAGDVASMGAGTAIAKIGVPALTRWSITNKAQAMGKAYQQSTRDIQAALGVSADDVHAARPFLEAVHAQSVPIEGKEDAAAQLVRAGNMAVDEIEQHVSQLISKIPHAMTPASGRAVLSKVAKMPGSRSADFDAARKVIAEYRLDQPRSLSDAESLRVRLNAENRATLEGTGVRQRTAAMTDAKYVARQEAANQLRDGIYHTLEQHGIEGIRDLRRAEGSILTLRNAADPLTRGLRSESTVARTGETSLLRRTAQHVLRGGGAAVGANVAGMPGAAIGAEIGQELGAGLTSKNMSRNALLDRAFRQRFTTPPVMSVQRGGGPVPSSPLSLPPGPARRQIGASIP